MSGDSKTFSILAKGIMGLYLAFLLCWAFRFQGCLPAVTDVMMHIYPDRVFTIGEWGRGLIPLWNPWIGCGVPEVGSWQSSCFYPLFWIWNLLGSPSSYVQLCLLHEALAFLGFYRFLRIQGLSRLVSVLGAFSFAGSALFVRCWAYPYHMAALAWIPWIFWSVHRALNKDQFQSWILVVLFLSLQLLTGYPPFVFYTVILLAAWFFFQRPSRGNILGLGLSFLGALGLTALQWLPFAEFLALGSHGGWWKYFPYYLLPAEYLTLFRFDVLGIPGSKDYGGTSANFVYNLYFGLVPLCLLLAGGWGTDKKKSSAFWGFAALFLLLWMAGGHFPLWRLFPENLLQGLEPSKAAPLFIFSASTYIAGRLQIRLSKPMKPIFFFVVLFLSLLWMVDLMRIPFAFANRIPNPFENADLARKAAQLKELAAGQRILSLTSDEEFGRSRTQGLLDPIVVPVQKMLVNTNIVWGLRSTQFYLTVWPESLNNLFRYTSQGYPYSGDLLDIAGVRLFLLSQPLPGPKYIPLEIGGDQDINLNPKASADIRWVPEKVELADRPAVLRRIAVPGSLWDRRIYVEKTADGREISLEPSLRDNPQTLAAGYQRSSAGWTSFSGNFQPGWVVFNETCFPGWRAWVDGKGKPILRTYGLFMGVAVEAGNHQVEFRYEPASFRLGLFLSLLTLAALLGRLAQPKTKKF